MSDSRTVESSGGFLLGLLGIAFIVLKLTGVIAWSWWWVLAPFWVPVAASALSIAGFLIFLLLVGRNPFRKRKKSLRDLGIR